MSRSRNSHRGSRSRCCRGGSVALVAALQLADAVAQVSGQVGLCVGIESIEEARHLDGTVAESSPEAISVRGLWLGGQLVLVAECVQVADGQLQDIGLFQFGHVFTFLEKQKRIKEKAD